MLLKVEKYMRRRICHSVYRYAKANKIKANERLWQK